MIEIREDLPGADLIRQGLEDLGRGVESVAALLVAIGAPRLGRLGLPVPGGGRLSETPELRLYRVLGLEAGTGAHSRYNALVRRLVSFERALEREQRRSSPRVPAGLPAFIAY